MANLICNIETKCTTCSQSIENMMTHHIFKTGYHFPASKCSQNVMIFILKGKMLVNSEEYAGTTLQENQFILQAIGSKIEMLALVDTECIIYKFKEPAVICCEERNNEIVTFKDPPLIYTPFTIVPPLQNYLNGMLIYIKDKLVCKEFLELKQKELSFILNCYYPLRDLYTLFNSISSYSNSFHHFVMQNYSKVKTVEELAHLGGYSVTTFRRMFRNLFNEPAYEWMLNQKRNGIMADLQYTKMSISEISNKYGFDALPHFSNFCKTCFGDSPRTLRKKMNKKPEDDNNLE